VRIVISSGHGKYIRGASGSPVPPQLDEVDEARKVVDKVAEFWRSSGVEVTTFHDNTSHDQNTNLNTIVNYHNSHLQPHDLDVSIHFNAYDGSAHGVECLYVTQQSLAKKVSDAVAAVGFTNRGPKKRTDLFFLNNTEEPAILVEVCFCDHTGDSNTYRAKFDTVCWAIAQAISGQPITAPPAQPPVEPPDERPPIKPPQPPSGTSKPVIGIGDEGPYVSEAQADLNRELEGCDLHVDGDFGSLTEEAVYDYQRSRGLDADGMIGEQTWAALDTHKPPYTPPGLPEPLTAQQQEEIAQIAINSEIASYSWDDRGQAPEGYVKGFALAWANTYRQLMTGYMPAVEMAEANTGNEKDVLYQYKDTLKSLGMPTDKDGPDTLRALWTIMMGLGMRESSGQHCCGRDMSADNVSSDTAEAGLYQTSWNAHSCSDNFDVLFDTFSAGEDSDNPQGFLDYFKEDVSCSSSDWQNYGSGDGAEFQYLCKNQPSFACETCAITLRNLCNHYGPVNRFEVEVKADAEKMLKAVQDYVDKEEDAHGWAFGD
jgi:peptidoglycan hydrolase-like protein with peptidoglycan-binding domain